VTLQAIQQSCDAKTTRLVAIGKDRITANAAAKLNLTLALGARRADGYHQFESLMSSVSLYDRLEFQLADHPGIQLKCNDATVPSHAGNLVVVGAELLASEIGIQPRLRITLHKTIPTQAGLGGGSADAATTLLALNRLWDVGLPMGRLAELASQLGSDVPFFLFGPLAICTGRGQKVRPLSFKWKFWALIIKPSVSLSTKAVYDQYQAGETQYMGKTTELVGRLAGLTAGQVAPLLFNALEGAAFRAARELKGVQQELNEMTSSTVRLCGSGSAFFALFDSAEQALAIGHRLSKYPDLTAWLVTNNQW